MAALAVTVDALTAAVDAHDRRLRRVERTAVRRSASARRRNTPRRHRPVAGWVDWLRSSYRLTDRLPESWPDDPMVVAELTALHTAWQAAYTSPGPSLEPVHFHDALGRVLSRVDEWRTAWTRRRVTGGALHARDDL